MKKIYFKPQAIAFTVRTENLMTLSARFGENTDTQYSKGEDSYSEKDEYFGW